MPELPEVETVRIGLSRLLPGRVVQAVTHDWPKSFPNAAHDVEQFLIGVRVVSVARRAKVLIIKLDSSYSLVIHLKMTGQLVFVGTAQQQNDKGSMSHAGNELVKSERPPSTTRLPDETEVRFGAGHPNDSLVHELPDKSTRVIFEFSDDSKLFFNDQRKFGWVRLLPTAEVPNIDFMQKVGPEPLDAEFTWRQFRDRLLRRKNSNIKAVLLDQSVVAGIGNIYADESLWGAKLHPETLIRDIPPAKFKPLFDALQGILRLAIEKGGSTDKNYVNAEGKRGSYLAFAKVFRREGQPCRRCGTIIIKTRVAARGTHICPKCQKL